MKPNTYRLSSAIGVRQNICGNCYLVVLRRDCGWQWKYYQSQPGFVEGWFDYGPSFSKKRLAEQWLDQSHDRL